MHNHLPLLGGLIFAHVGFLLLSLQIIVADLGRAYLSLRRSVTDDFGHDTRIFPDHDRFLHH